MTIKNKFSRAQETDQNQVKYTRDQVHVRLVM